MMCVSSVAIDDAEESSEYPELLKDVLCKMVVVSNEELVKLYFQWKVCLLHENEW